MNCKTITETFSSGSKEKILGILRDTNPEQTIYARFENGTILKTTYQPNDTQSIFIHNDKRNFEQDFIDEWLYSIKKFCYTNLLTLDNKFALTKNGNFFRRCNGFSFCNDDNIINEIQKENCGIEKIEFTDGDLTWTGVGCSYCQTIRHGQYNMSHELYSEEEQKLLNITETKFYCPLWAKDYLASVK
jgi:hypothetical protein